MPKPHRDKYIFHLLLHKPPYQKKYRFGIGNILLPIQHKTFPEKELFCNYMNRMNEDKIFLLGVSDEKEAGELAECCGAQILKLENGGFNK